MHYLLIGWSPTRSDPGRSQVLHSEEALVREEEACSVNADAAAQQVGNN